MVWGWVDMWAGLQGEACTALHSWPAAHPAEKMHRECQATMKGARAPLCRTRSLSWETQRAPACAIKGRLFFSGRGLHSQHVSEAGLLWGRWRVVLSAGDVKTSAPSDWIAPLHQVPWAELLCLCHNLSTLSTPKFIFQLCDWNGYKRKCRTLESEKASLLWGCWDPGMDCREGGWLLSWEIPRPGWWWSWAACSRWCPWVEVRTFYWKSHMWQSFCPSHLRICLNHSCKQSWELPQLQESPFKSSVFLALEDTPSQANNEISCAEPESSQIF